MSAGGMSQGQIVAVVSAVALAVSVFLAWGGYGFDAPAVPDVSGIPGGEAAAEAAQDAVEDSEDEATASGWDFQRVLSIYLLILSGLVLGNLVMRQMGNPDGIPFAPPAATFLLGAIGLILTLYVVLDAYPGGGEREFGIFIATAAVAGVAIGSFLQMRDEVAELY